MKKYILTTVLFVALACKEQGTRPLTAQQIVDKSIEVCGGDNYSASDITFDFRDKTYALEILDGKRIMRRITTTDTIVVIDERTSNDFKRYVNDSLVVVHDTMAVKYSNSINSVHYFTYLPYGLNDPAVNKELLGKVNIKDKGYYKLKVTFDEEGGGDDFDDTYVYWFNIETMKPDYLAYEFHVDGGGMRFREAFNERYIDGIRFVDYNNYKTKDSSVPIFKIDSLYQVGSLELLSKIEIRNINLE